MDFYNSLLTQVAYIKGELELVKHKSATAESVQEQLRTVNSKLWVIQQVRLGHLLTKDWPKSPAHTHNSVYIYIHYL